MRDDLDKILEGHLKRRERAARGRSSTKRGRALEDDLKASLAHDARRMLVRNEPTIAPVGNARGGGLLYRVTGRGWVDFTFYGLGGPLNVANFDAKSTVAQDAWVIGKRLDHTHPEGHQGRKLCQLAEGGHKAAVVVRRETPLAPGLYVVPWSATGAPFAPTKQAPWRALEPWRVPRGVEWWECFEVEPLAWLDFARVGWGR